MIRVLPQSEEDKVLKQSKDLLAKGKNLDPEELIDLHYQIAYIYEQQNKMAASYREVKKASVLVSKVTDPLIKADHYFWLAGGAKENGDFEKAMNLLYQAEETAYNAGTDQGMQKYAFYLTRDIHWLLEKVDISSLREEDIESVLTEISNIIDEYHVTDIDTISSYYMELCKHQCYAGIDDKIVLETMEKGAAAMQRLSTSDYFYIDNVILFKFDVYQALLMYDEARKVLEEGVELCNRYADMLPYIRKKLDLLLDLACVYHNIRQPSMAKKYYDQIAEILENTDGLHMSQEFISDYETYRL
jgi:tetratricopeptide (TPR) repeat protein